jgi:hypothetical protein
MKKMSEEQTQKKPAGKWSQAIIAIESILYSFGISILLLPVYIGLHIFKGLKWFAVKVPVIFTWFIETIVVPICIIAFTVVTLIFDLVVECVLYLCIGIRYIYVFLHNYWVKINWCAVRSSIRIISIICIVGSIYAIVEGYFQLPPDTAIITGRFFDTNGTVFRIHEAIALLMISITTFYNAWAYSKKEEVSFICSHTVGIPALRKIRNKVLNKKE